MIEEIEATFALHAKGGTEEADFHVIVERKAMLTLLQKQGTDDAGFIINTYMS